jgi:hypothetical protein
MLSPYQLISRAEEIGLDGIAITEHDHTWSRQEIEGIKRETDTGLLILRGQEVSSMYGHLLVFGHSEYLAQYSLNEIIEKVRINGGIVIPSHPFRYGNTDRDINDLRMEFEQFDAIEALNGNQDEFQNRFGIRIMEELGLTGVGGGDAHSARMIGSYATEFYNEIRNEEDLIREIKAGRCKPVAKGL